MDMAWNMDAVRSSGWKKHFAGFLDREFGSRADDILPLMTEHYRLAFIHKPEYMGNTRTEERDPKYSRISDLPFSEEEILERMESYARISDKVEKIGRSVPAADMDKYFQLVKYPVQASAQMNFKLLHAQLARHGKSEWEKSDAAYDSIAALTETYNRGFANGGKWNGIMDCRPRRLPVFNKVERTLSDEPMPAFPAPAYEWNGTECTAGSFTPCEGLGYEEKAASVAPGNALHFDFKAEADTSVLVELCLLPVHPVDGRNLRISVSVDGGKEHVVDYATFGRTEEWKMNVLYNHAVRRFILPLEAAGRKHRLTVKAIDEGVVVDQVRIYAPDAVTALQQKRKSSPASF